jgi:hypothetical protein
MSLRGSPGGCFGSIPSPPAAAAGAEDEFKTVQAKLLKEKKTLDLMDQIIQDLTKSKGST